MDIFETLNNELLKQPFDNTNDIESRLKYYLQIACIYAKVENSIAVLSDLKSNKSYIYHGKITDRLGINANDNTTEINSIWEDDILRKIHVDDLLGKHMLELKFFHFLKSKVLTERPNYHIISKIRMKDQYGTYIPIQHRMFYIAFIDESPWLALCLYNYSFDKSITNIYEEGIIVNSATGDIYNPDQEKYNSILTKREKEILLLIQEGKMSYEIADILSISKHTVDRHRQNILEKLRVNNSIEAIRIAKHMSLL